jgi:hypothetical protein
MPVMGAVVCMPAAVVVVVSAVVCIPAAVVMMSAVVRMLSIMSAIVMMGVLLAMTLTVTVSVVPVAIVVMVMMMVIIIIIMMIGRLPERDSRPAVPVNVIIRHAAAVIEIPTGAAIIVGFGGGRGDRNNAETGEQRNRKAK